MKARAADAHPTGTPLPRIVLTGFMGTGKTESGRALAGILGLDFVDTDRLVEEAEGMTVAEIFERRGEDHFRRREREVCDLLGARSAVVIATGGGTLLDPGNFARLSDGGRVVLLEARVEEILKRVGGDGTRPLLGGNGGSGPEDGRLRERVVSILREREPVYRRIGQQVDTSDVTPQEVACRIASSLDLPSKRIDTTLAAGGSSGSGAVRIEIGRGLLSALGRRLCELRLDSRAFILVPENLRALFLPQIAWALEQEAVPWDRIPVRDGDASKNLDQVREVIDLLASRGATRDSTIVAVGGGVVGDLAGFAASVYMRGVSLVHVPTTLLAQVDSSIGGKVGVNHPSAKNLVGSFHPARLVLCDPCTLRTLPDREISNGMAEVVKTALVGSPALFRFIEESLDEDPALSLRSVGFLERCAGECAAVKSSIVERDPFEKDERRVLNLGHTLGHALEAAAGYADLAHGEAVSVGLAAAMRISRARGLVEAALVERTRRVLERSGLPVDPPGFDEARFRESLQLDKKKRAGRLHFVLPTGIGSVTIVDDVSEEEVRSAMGRAVE